MADTRKDKRAPVSLKVRFKSATVDEFVEQYSKDISRGGLFIKSKTPMIVGTLLKFELQLKDQSRLIHGVGRVVWKREASDSTEDHPAGMGIKFIKMDGESRAMVDKMVEGRAESGSFEQGTNAGAAADQPFFPTTSTPDQLPAHEDRTQIRHASEFLASALAGGDEDAAKEAQESAERARKRTEELERERAAAAAEAAKAKKAAEEEARKSSKPPAKPNADQTTPSGHVEQAALGKPKSNGVSTRPAATDAARKASERPPPAAPASKEPAAASAESNRPEPKASNAASNAPVAAKSASDRPAASPAARDVGHNAALAEKSSRDEQAPLAEKAPPLETGTIEGGASREDRRRAELGAAATLEASFGDQLPKVDEPEADEPAREAAESAPRKPSAGDVASAGSASPRVSSSAAEPSSTRAAADRLPRPSSVRASSVERSSGSSRQRSEPAPEGVEPRTVRASDSDELADRDEARSRVSSRPAPADEEPRSSYTLPLMVGIIAAVAIGFFMWQNAGTPETATDDSAPADLAGEELAEAIEPAEAEPTEATEEDALAAGATGETGAEAAEAEEPAIPPDAPTVPVRITSAPPGAELTINGEPRGKTPAEVELPIGYDAVVSLRREGYQEATETVKAVEGQKPLRYRLAPMEYVLIVQTNPEGARVSAGGQATQSPGEIILRGPVRRPVPVVAVKAGFVRSRDTVQPDSFMPVNGRMQTQVSFDLQPRAAAATPRRAARRPTAQESSETAATADESTEKPTKAAPTKAGQTGSTRTAPPPRTAPPTRTAEPTPTAPPTKTAPATEDAPPTKSPEAKTEPAPEESSEPTEPKDEGASESGSGGSVVEGLPENPF